LAPRIGVHPAFFRKNADPSEEKRVVKHSWCKERKERRRSAGRRTPGSREVPPVFFVSVASKGFSQAVSLLFATLAGESISVAAKGFRIQPGWKGERSPPPHVFATI
jgi:hypothetical protein